MITHVKGTKGIDLTDLTQRFSGLSRDYVNGENMTYQDWKDLHSDDPAIKEAAREKWKESEKSEQRKQRYYG